MKDVTSAVQDFNKAIFSGTFEESQKLYEDLGKDFDDNQKVLGIVSQRHCALLFKKHAKDINPSLVLDLAGGSGYASEHIRRDAEYKGEIDIMDANMELLYLASKKSLGFRNIIRHLIVDQLPVPDHSYDAVICVGSFLPNHIPASSIPAVVRVVRPGGLFIFNLRAQSTEDYNAELDAVVKKCVDEGKMKLIERLVYQHLPNKDPNFLGHAFVYRCN